ncbi:hypothetical protein ACMGGR_17755 [Erwinia sp. BNK-24-b]|uniref:hypothetical protein n=1 Tax=unclassified Erwinia TaxID=2622719 RepID=UPI0039BFF616
MLSIRTSGKKIRRFRYQHPDFTARTNITLGYYPAISLAAACTLHDEYPGSNVRHKRRLPKLPLFLQTL